MTAGFFIAGTDTAVGKTRVAAGLLSGFRELGLRAAGMKPVAAGEILSDGLKINEDVGYIATVTGQSVVSRSLNRYCFADPISPNLAALNAGICIDIDAIRQDLVAISADADIVVVEGAGGWLTPISDRLTMADVAAALTLPVVLVVGLRLGCLNHALLTVSSIKAHGLRLAGWVGSRLDPQQLAAEGNVDTLTQRLGAPLATLPWSVDRSADSRWLMPAIRSLHAQSR